jgi:alpha-1,2-mannosyltransferase
MPREHDPARTPRLRVPLTASTLCLAAWFVVNSVLMNVILLRFAGQGGARSRGLTTAYQLQAVVDGRLGTDSWMPMRAAYEQYRAAPDLPLYREIFFARHVKFQYPPASLFLPFSIDALGLGDRVLNVVSVMAMVLTAIVAVMLLEHARAEFIGPAERPSWMDRASSAGAALGLALSFYPLVRGVANGQLQTWVTALLAVAVWGWARDREGLAGGLVGLVCQLKPQYAGLLLWGLARRRRRFCGGFLAASIAAGALALAAFGWRNHADYLAVLGFMSRHGETYFPNQSVNGLLNRMLFNGNNLRWNAAAFAPFHPWVFIGTLITSALLIGMALFWRRAEHRRAGTVDLAIAILTFTVASPIAWEHHYGVLLPIYAVAAPALVRWPVLGRATLPALAVSYALASNYFGHVAVLAAGGAFNFVQSYLLFAALLLLLLLYRLRAAMARPATGPVDAPERSAVERAPGPPAPAPAEAG